SNSALILVPDMFRFTLARCRRQFFQFLFRHRVIHGFGRAFQTAHLRFATLGSQGSARSLLLVLRFCRHEFAPYRTPFASSLTERATAPWRSAWFCPCHLTLSLLFGRCTALPMPFGSICYQMRDAPRCGYGKYH